MYQYFQICNLSPYLTKVAWTIFKCILINFRLNSRSKHIGHKSATLIREDQIPNQMKIETLIMSWESNKIDYLSKQNLERNERYTSESVLDLGEQLAGRLREKTPLFPEK